MRRASCVTTVASLACLWASAGRGAASPDPAATAEEPALAVPALDAPDAAATTPGQRDLRQPHYYTLVEDFTADTLAAGEWMIGTDLSYGVSDRVMIGTDLVATFIGAPTLKAKWNIWQRGNHSVALGLRGAYLSRNTALWGTLKQDFTTLDARVVVPSVSWTRALSPRLHLHTYFAKSFGKITARLSPEGDAHLWEAKHPGADYSTRDPVTQAPAGSDLPSTANRETVSSQRSALMQQSIQVQSVAGLAAERFQLTGEFDRVSGNKVIVTSDIEQTVLERLRTTFFRLTVAHQWIWPSFQMRIGFGPQYFVATGTDLDGEKLNEAGWTPASDISFYWRF